MDSRFAGKMRQVELPHGFVATWDSLAGDAGRGFTLHLDDDLDEERVTLIRPSHRELPDGAVTDAWLTAPSGAPGHLYDALWHALTAAADHALPGLPDTRPHDFAELVAAVLALPGVGPDMSEATIAKSFRRSFAPGVWPEVDETPALVTKGDLVDLYRLVWAVDPDFATREFRVKPHPVGLRVDFKASTPDRQSLLDSGADAWLDRMEARAPGVPGAQG